MKNVGDLTSQDIIHLVKAYKIQIDLGVYNQQMDYIFEELRSSEVKGDFFRICNLYGL